MQNYCCPIYISIVRGVEGLGDPSAVPYAVKSVHDLVGKVPVFGICVGHQLLGQALGGTTFEMKFGHHVGNHPVRHLPTGRVEISAQNHNYAVDPNTLPEGVEVTHINLNECTCAGLTFPAMKAMSIQYHSEPSPGPHDSDHAFFDFVEMMKKNRLETNAFVQRWESGWNIHILKGWTC